MTKMILMLILPFLIFSALHCFAQIADSLIEWEPVQRMTFDSVNSYVPRLETFGSNVYLCWYGGAENSFARSTDSGVSWQAPVLLTDTFPPFYSNGRFAVSNNYIYFCTVYNYLTSDTSLLGLWLQRSTDYGATWEEGKVISDWGRESYSITAEGEHVVLNYVIRGEISTDQGFAHSSDYGETWIFFDERLHGNTLTEIVLRGGYSMKRERERLMMRQKHALAIAQIMVKHGPLKFFFPQRIL